MRNRHHQFDVAHTLTAYFLLSYFNTTAITDNAFVTNPFVFTAMTFPVLNWPEDALAEQAAHFRLISPVVDRLRLCYLTVGTLQNRLRRCQADGHALEVAIEFLVLFERHWLEIIVFKTLSLWPL